MDELYLEHHGAVSIGARIDQMRAGINEHGFVINVSYPEDGGPTGVAFTVGRHLIGRPEFVATGPFDGPAFGRLLNAAHDIDKALLAQEAHDGILMIDVIAMFDPCLPEPMQGAVAPVEILMQDNDPMVWIRQTFPDEDVRVVQLVWGSPPDEPDVQPIFPFKDGSND